MDTHYSGLCMSAFRMKLTRSGFHIRFTFCCSKIVPPIILLLHKLILRKNVSPKRYITRVCMVNSLEQRVAEKVLTYSGTGQMQQKRKRSETCDTLSLAITSAVVFSTLYTRASARASRSGAFISPCALSVKNNTRIVYI